MEREGRNDGEEEETQRREGEQSRITTKQECRPFLGIHTWLSGPMRGDHAFSPAIGFQSVQHQSRSSDGHLLSGRGGIREARIRTQLSVRVRVHNIRRPPPKKNKKKNTRTHPKAINQTRESRSNPATTCIPGIGGALEAEVVRDHAEGKGVFRPRRKVLQLLANNVSNISEEARMCDGRYATLLLPPPPCAPIHGKLAYVGAIAEAAAPV